MGAARRPPAVVRVVRADQEEARRCVPQMPSERMRTKLRNRGHNGRRERFDSHSGRLAMIYRALFGGNTADTIATEARRR